MLPDNPTSKQLKEALIESLKQQGFIVSEGAISLPADLDKDGIRTLHSMAVNHRIDVAAKTLQKHEEKLLQRIASGEEVVPEKIEPRLVEVTSRSENELLFRYATLHWSIPVSSGYGRRLRFLVVDSHNDKLIGVFGLGDPVFSMTARDQWVGWDKEMRRARLRHVMDAFVLGAVPPYSELLGGKLVASLVVSNEVREAFRRKYEESQSVILDRPFDGKLALITTTSALGRSSIYNRLKLQDRRLFESVGFTRGYGDFHFFNGLYDIIARFTELRCKPTAKQEKWGKGFRNRREVVRKCLAELGLSPQWLRHGIRREAFVIPMAANTREFLRGEHSDLQWFERPASDIFEWFRHRWLIPRAHREPGFKEFARESYRLWD